MEKGANQHLLRKIEFLESFFNHALDAIYLLDDQENVILTNPAFENIYGWTDQEMLNQPLRLIHQDLHDHFKLESNRLSYIKQPLSLETWGKRKDGTLFPVYLTISPIQDTKSNRMGSCIIAKNITHYYRSLESLLASEVNYQRLVESTFDVIGIYDTQLNKKMISPSIEIHTGYSQEEYMSIDAKSSIHPEDLEKVTTAIQSLITNKQMEELTYRGKHKDGSWVYLEARGIPILDQNQEVANLLIINRNITERKLAEEALRQSEAKYRFIAENTMDLIIVFDERGKVIYRSPSYYHLLGYEDYDHESIFYGRIHPDDLQPFKEKVRLCNTSHVPIKIEYRFQHANGDWIHLESQGGPTFSSNGELVGYVFITRDITERKRNEILLRQAEKLSLIGELAAGIAHEIRNPLTALKGFIQYLYPTLNEKKNIADILLIELEHINLIASELLILAKPQNIQLKSTNLQDVLKSVIILLRPEAILRNIQLFSDLGEQAHYVECNEHQLKQVFINLIKNSMDAISSKGEIHIQTEVIEENQVRIRFKDNGCGIPEEMIAKLGEPFYTTKEKGTGLGLMISHKIIKDFNGSIHFTSQMYVGTTVDIILPMTSY